MIKFLKEIKNPKDKFFLALMIFTICEQTIFVFPILILARALGLESAYGMITTLIYVVLTIGSITNRRVSYISFGTIGFALLVVFSIVFTYLYHPENAEYLAKGWQESLKPVIPWLFLGTCFYADKISMETIGKWCTLGVFFLSWFLLVSNNQLGGMTGEYDMQASYRLLLSTLITINYAFSSKNGWAILASAVGVLYAFAMGTRGPVLVVLVFIMILILQRMMARGKNKIRMYALIGVGLSLFIFIGTTPILSFSQAALAKAGFSTRVLDKALEEEVFQDNSRTIIYETLMNDLQRDPSPHGLYAEKRFGFFSPHNLYIGILYYYGYILGAIILLTLALLPLTAYRKSNNPLAKQWILMFACYIFIHGLFGGSFLSTEVFFLLGFCVKEIKTKHYYKQVQ